MGTLWHRQIATKAFAASLHPAEAVIEPRRYVAQSSTEVTFYDGLAIDRTGKLDAHRAEQLAAHWDQLPETLEGSFMMVRLRGDPPSLEVLTDPLGIGQLYWLQQSKTWLLSNSVHLLSQVGHITELDPLAISMFLTLGWVGADRTLQRGILVVPGGRHITWSGDQDSPSVRPYFPRASLARRESVRPGQIKELALHFVDSARYLSRNFGPIHCPLTAGKDSRLLASILIKGDIPASYWTSGSPSSTDVMLGTRIAAAFRLPHNKLTNLTEDPGEPREEVVRDWERLTRRLILQNDGMTSLYAIPDILGQPARIDRLGLILDGIGGEIARSFYGTPDWFLSKPTAETMLSEFPRRLARRRASLVEPHAVQLAQAYIRQFLEECLEEGFTPLDLPDIFYADERVRRWAGNTVRETLPVEDTFRFLCTRPFVEAAFSLSPIYRYSERLHYELTQFLSPKLHRMPYEHQWRSQWPLITLASAWIGKLLGRMPGYRIRNRVKQGLAKLGSSGKQPTEHVPIFDRGAWLEAKRPEIREVCLGSRDSLIWSFVNRSAFEQLMSARAEAKERDSCQELLYSIATMFYYEAAAKKS